MKIRVKFSKSGPMVFVGHLDIMRYFQKAIRRSGLDVIYTTGFSPHQIMSFAAPLGVGIYSQAEYMDLEINSHEGCSDFLKKLNDTMVPGIEILSVVALPEHAGNVMASVAAASYQICYKKPEQIPANLDILVESFFQLPEIMVRKQTKKQDMMLNIKPSLFQMQARDGSIFFTVDASSSGNVKPTLVMKAFCDYALFPYDTFDYKIIREELYTNTGTAEAPVLVPMDAIGDLF